MLKLPGLLQRPPWWFWPAVALGAAVRIYFVFFTNGTTDVEIWQGHAAGIAKSGLIGYYHSNALGDHPPANHPPFISVAEWLLLRVANGAGIPFRVLLRLPFGLLDAGVTAVLISLLRPQPWRFAAGACYWLHPLAMILSSYHGNTDTAVAFSLVLSVWFLSKGNAIGAGMALGAGFWIKLPGAPAIPALLILARGRRQKVVFLAATAMTALLTYLPALFQDPRIVCSSVFGYRGQMLQTTAGAPVWGLPSILLSGHWQDERYRALIHFVKHDWEIGLALMWVLTWLRRARRTPAEVCATIAAGYAVLFGFTDYWAFQYLAWALPFWFFCRKWFAIPASILAGGYIYSLYWLLCGNPWLRGKWDFLGHPHWPPVVTAFRDITVLFFFLSACCFLASAAADWMRVRREQAGRGVCGGSP